ncbi:hypothetical protein D9M71_673010 [compost metagenome]
MPDRQAACVASSPIGAGGSGASPSSSVRNDLPPFCRPVMSPTVVWKPLPPAVAISTRWVGLPAKVCATWLPDCSSISVVMGTPSPRPPGRLDTGTE